VADLLKVQKRKAVLKDPNKVANAAAKKKKTSKTAELKQPGKSDEQLGKPSCDSAAPSPGIASSPDSAAASLSSSTSLDSALVALEKG